MFVNHSRAEDDAGAGSDDERPHPPASSALASMNQPRIFQRGMTNTLRSARAREKFEIFAWWNWSRCDHNVSPVCNRRVRRKSWLARLGFGASASCKLAARFSRATTVFAPPHECAQPRSARISCPVTHALRSLARNKITSAISSGWMKSGMHWRSCTNRLFSSVR